MASRWLVVLRASGVVCNARPGVSATKTELIPVAVTVLFITGFPALLLLFPVQIP